MNKQAAIGVVIGIILLFLCCICVSAIGALVYITNRSSSISCVYNGKTYQNGQGFPSTDGCNTCSCSNGQIACTLMYCVNGSAK